MEMATVVVSILVAGFLFGFGHAFGRKTFWFFHRFLEEYAKVRSWETPRVESLRKAWYYTEWF
jgi:hypothetical protein